MRMNDLTTKTTPADFAEALHDDCGYQFISGKYFLPASKDRYFAVPQDEVQRRLLNYKNSGKRVLKDATAAQNVMKTFEAQYGGADGYDWHDPILWFDAVEWDESKYVELPFEIPLKTLMLINALLTDNGKERFFIMFGRGGTGKSTTLNLVRQIFENDFCAMTLDQLTERFNGAVACEKRLICADEVNTFQLDSGRLKTIVSQQRDTVENKGQRRFEIQWQSKLLYCCNKPPRFDVSDSGLMRRVVYYKMDEIKSTPNPALQKVVFSREQLLTIIHMALRVDMTDWFDNYFRADTFEAVFMTHSVYIHRYATDYSDYVERCRNSGLKPVAEPNWQNIKDEINTWEEKLNETR